MATTETFAAVVRERFNRLVEEQAHNSTSAVEAAERGLLRLRLAPKSPAASPVTIFIEDGAGCTVYIGAHGRFEHLPEDAEVLVGLLEAAISGKVRETVWEWKGKPLRVLTEVKVGERSFRHDWSSLVGTVAKLVLWPWVKTRQIQYQPYTV